jgi:hypothetical protein
VSQADLEEGRRAYAGRRWDVCVEALRAADADDALSGEDLKLLGLSPYMTGEDEASAEMLERTHRWVFDHERWPEAAETAFWYAFILFNSGEPARGGAWLARSRSIVEDLDVEGSTAAEQLAHAGAGEPSSLKSMLRGGRVRALAGEASASCRRCAPSLRLFPGALSNLANWSQTRGPPDGPRTCRAVRPSLRLS